MRTHSRQLPSKTFTQSFWHICNTLFLMVLCVDYLQCLTMLNNNPQALLASALSTSYFKLQDLLFSLFQLLLILYSCWPLPQILAFLIFVVSSFWVCLLSILQNLMRDALKSWSFDSSCCVLKQNKTTWTSATNINSEFTLYSESTINSSWINWISSNSSRHKSHMEEGFWCLWCFPYWFFFFNHGFLLKKCLLSC